VILDKKTTSIFLINFAKIKSCYIKLQIVTYVPRKETLKENTALLINTKF
jgi:hypothetical protein